MMPRITFILIAAFWVGMNVLLWRAEYSSHGGETPVPLDLVWRKILTAPDISSLTIFQNGQRVGFCEFSTSVEQEMADLDENSLPPEGISAHKGYQIRLNGNVSLDNFTNRFRFDGKLQFSSLHDWKELSLKISERDASVAIHSLATNQMVSLQTISDGSTNMNTFTFASLQKPSTLMQMFLGNSGAGLFDGFDFPEISQTSALTQNIHWQATRERITISHEPVSVYRLETEILGNKTVIYVSTLGEIIRAEFPGGITATIDGMGKS